ncbi:hypothetical protein [Aquibacillus kalidii]|uniref:hypothetical protein n=1 Tax=Aquibacillus kalidii TaxID=2762597 RepID=UPI00164450A5|nr:hypothetical protein [Aquibacillus kalidii]
MINKNKGYLFVEVIACICILFSLLLTITPILHQISIEEMMLKQRRTILSALDDALTKTILDTDKESKYPIKKQRDILNIEVFFSFEKKTNLIKGCAKWTNDKNNTERYCLYGIQSSE